MNEDNANDATTIVATKGNPKYSGFFLAALLHASFPLPLRGAKGLEGKVMQSRLIIQELQVECVILEN